MIVQQALELTTVLRHQVGNRPFLLFLAVLLLLSIIARRRARDAAQWPAAAVLPLGLAAVALVGYVVTMIWYVSQPQYADPAEATMAAVGWLFETGRPIYHAVDSAERYSHMYGPLAFAIPGWSLAVFGTGIVASKVAGAIAGFCTVAALFALTRHAGGSRSALMLTGLFAALCLAFGSVSFWIRPDSFQLLAAAVALLAVVSLPGSVLPIGVLGIATGVLADLKMTGPFYALPAFGVLIADRRLASAGAAAALALAVAATPFVLFENVSLANYVLWTGTSAKNGLVFWILKLNIEWALFLLVPLTPGLILRDASPADRWLRGGVIAGMVGVVLAGSKPGAGPYHLLPFVPAVLYAAALTLGRMSPGQTSDTHAGRVVAAFAVTVAIVAALQTSYFVRIATRTSGMDLVGDLERFVRQHPSARIEMGYSAENEAFVYVRPVLVFHQGTYLLDAPAVQEHQMSGVDLPLATIRAIERCEVQLWLIPRGGQPFSLRNRYPQTAYAPLFPEAFRIAFDRTYQRVGTTAYFDVWGCRGTSG